MQNGFGKHLDLIKVIYYNRSILKKVKRATLKEKGKSIMRKTETRKIEDLVTREPFSALFPIAAGTVEQIVTNMNARGYDQAFPIVLWKGNKNREDIVLDGHTRIEAAGKVGMSRVPVIFKSFKDEDAALQYSIHNQRSRRNLTDAEILSYIENEEAPATAGGDRKSKNFKETGTSSKKTAKALGTNATKVEQARKVAKEGDEKTKQDVKAGKKSIGQAAKDIKDKPVVSKKKLARSNRDFSFARYIWTIDSADEASQKVPLNTKPVGDYVDDVLVFLSNDLLVKENTKKFVEETIAVMKEASEFYFMVTTSQLGRLKTFDWDETKENIWLGTYVANDKQVANAVTALSHEKVQGGTNFIIVKEVDKYLDLTNLYTNKCGIKWLILGGGENTTWEDVYKIYQDANEKGIPVYFLPSINIAPKEYPA